MKKKKRRMQWLSCLLMCVMLINFVVLSTVSDASDIKKITMEEETTKPSIETQINEPLFELEETTNQITSLINNPAFHCETLLQALYASGHFYEVFQNLAEDTRENFYQKLSGEELYQFSTLAQYALVNEFVTYQKKEHLTEQDMQSLAAFFDCYVTVCKKEMPVTTQQELEEAVVELVRTGCSKEKTMQTKEGQTKIEQIISLSTYIEYLQNLESSSSEEFPFEFQEFLQNFSENVKNFTQSESIQVFQKCMYETYGFATLYQELINKKSESEQQEELVQKTIEPLVSEEHRPVLEHQESSIDLSGLVTGSDADHTHIFESKLDNTFHWKECFLCKKVIEKERHTIITDGNGATCSDYVILGKEMCSQNCGYSKEIKKLPHIYPPNVSYSDFTGTRHLIHTCSRCGSVGEEPHKFRVGGGEYTVYQMQDMGWNIHTLGKQTCSICNLTVDLSKHNGWGYLCYLCKGTYAPRLYFEVPGNQIVNGKLKLDFVNANSQTVYLEMQGSGVASISARIISANPNFTVGSLTGIETLPNDRHRYSFTVSVKDRNKPIDQEFVLFGETSNKYNAGAWIDGYQTVTDFYGTTSINVVPDATGPTIQSITAKDVATAGEWASSKQLTISGSSAKNTMVYASMYYDTWVPVFQKKAVSVVNGQYSVSDIPVLEVDQPRTFHFKVEDAFGNEVWSTKILGKIDNRAPKMISSKDYINGWSKTKEVKITTEDGGINQVSIGFNSMSDISIGTLDGVNSTKTYRFTGDVYDVVTGAVYMRDGLGNIATERIQIGKLDQTGPTVTKIKKTATMDQVVLDITASDYCKKVEGEGSGVVSYALTTSDQTPPASAFQSNPQFTVSENGTYKVWAKDLVENISKAESVVVDEIAYTVQFLDANGTVLKTEQVPKGGTATPPTPLPQKEGYHFTKWDVAITNITSNTIVKPVFEINRYHATYLDAQGKVFETVEVEHGADVVVPTKEPTKEGYHFIRWDTTPTKVIADVVVTPVFAINVYHATYLDAQGKVFETVEVEHGSDVVVPTKEPTKEGYHFIQWDTTPTNVTQNVTVCPVFEINVYQVTYLDAYGNVFKKLFLKHGEAPVEPTETPTKIGSHFVKWEFLPTKVTEDIRLTPVFAVNQYTVCFLDEKGNVLETQTINYGEKASVPKVVPEKRGYHFLRWNRRFTTITKDLIVEPVFERNQYQVTFLDGQTQVFEIQTVKYGQDADIPTKEPQKIGYHFVAWDCNIMNITKNLTVTPIFEKNVYEVTYVDGDGDVFQKEIVEHGANAIVPKDHPIKEGYHFTDWDKLPTEVVADQTVRPNFIINVYEVTYIDGEGRVFQTVEVEHGADVVVPSDHPIKKGYHFVKWEETPSAVTSDKTVGPVFEKDQQTVESSHTTSDYHIIKTGDASSLFLYIFLGIIAIVVVCVVIKRK